MVARVEYLDRQRPDSGGDAFRCKSSCAGEGGVLIADPEPAGRLTPDPATGGAQVRRNGVATRRPSSASEQREHRGVTLHLHCRGGQHVRRNSDPRSTQRLAAHPAERRAGADRLSAGTVRGRRLGRTRRTARARHDARADCDDLRAAGGPEHRLREARHVGHQSGAARGSAGSAGDRPHHDELMGRPGFPRGGRAHRTQGSSFLPDCGRRSALPSRRSTRSAKATRSMSSSMRSAASAWSRTNRRCGA